MDKQSEMIKKVIDASTLESILLKGTNSDIAVPPILITPDITKVNVDYSFSHVFDAESKVLFSFVAVDLIGSMKPEAKANNPSMVLENDRLFGCHSVFVARYSVNAQLEQAECEIFTRTNALFNVYPYLREHVSAELAKMGLPGVYLPLLKPPRPSNENVAAAT